MLKQILEEYSIAPPDTKLDVLFIDFLFSWIETMKNSIEITSYECYKEIQTRYTKSYFESKAITLRKLEPIHIQSMYNHFLEKRLEFYNRSENSCEYPKSLAVCR